MFSSKQNSLRVILLLFPLLLLFAACDAGAQSATLPQNATPPQINYISGPGNAPIAYTCLPSTRTTTICLSGLDGSHLHVLTQLPAESYAPQWSPDGKRIAFTVTDAAQNFSDIWVMNADGSSAKNVTNSPQQGNGSPSWSPDGKQLVFNASSQGRSALYLINADGSQKHLLFNGADAEGPVWSPDGETLAFTSTLSNASTAIYTLNLHRSGTPTRITQGSGEYSVATWSPNSKHLLYSFAPDSQTQTSVYKMDANGSGQTRLASPSTTSVTYFYPTSWSPDGTRILFVGVDRSNERQHIFSYTIWVLNATGPGQFLLHLPDQPQGDAVWRP